MASRTRDSAGFLRAQDWTITTEKPPKRPGKSPLTGSGTSEVSTVGATELDRSMAISETDLVRSHRARSVSS